MAEYLARRTPDDYRAAMAYLHTRADEIAREALPGTQFEREAELLEAPSTTGGKVYYTAVYAVPGESRDDPERQAVVVHVYGSTERVSQGKGMGTSYKQMLLSRTASHIADVQWRKRDKGYEPVRVPLERISMDAFTAVSPMGQLAGVAAPPHFSDEDLYGLSPQCFPDDRERVEGVVKTVVEYHLHGLRHSAPHLGGVTYGYTRVEPSATGRWWKVGWICGFGCAISPTGEVAPLSDEEMQAEARAFAQAQPEGLGRSDVLARLRVFLGVPRELLDRLDLTHADALIAGALEALAADPATAGADRTTEAPDPATKGPDLATTGAGGATKAPNPAATEVDMKPCRAMQRLVTRLLDQHGVDLDYPEAHLKLRLPGDTFMPLVIERIGPTRLSVAHYYVHDEWSGELVADPDVEIFTGTDPWVPLAIQHPPPFGYMVAAELSEDGHRVERFKRKAQADLATFVNQWARNLKAQGFLTEAAVEDKKTWPVTTPDSPSTTGDPDPATAPEPTPGLPDALDAAANTLTVGAVLENKACKREEELSTGPDSPIQLALW